MENLPTLYFTRVIKTDQEIKYLLYKYMLKYHPYKSDKPSKSILLSRVIIKRFLGGASGMNDFYHS
jgi:hypothetical protein